jgi:hypothetical protein
MGFLPLKARYLARPSLTVGFGDRCENENPPCCRGRKAEGGSQARKSKTTKRAFGSLQDFAEWASTVGPADGNSFTSRREMRKCRKCRVEMDSCLVGPGNSKRLVVYCLIRSRRAENSSQMSRSAGRVLKERNGRCARKNSSTV